MKLKGAILVIGSLLWDEAEHRKNWRKSRLIMNEKIHVKVPIRYGRYSGTTENKHYTMVFSNDCEVNSRLGVSFVIPIKNKEIKTLQGILNQGRALSKAEEKESDGDSKLVKGNTVKWATICILFNPQLDELLRDDILSFWKKVLLSEGGLSDIQRYAFEGESSILSNKGELLINWPESIDKCNKIQIDNFDFILTTCTKHKNENNRYPTVQELNQNVSKDKRKYFYNNILNGISTFEDTKIINY